MDDSSLETGYRWAIVTPDDRSGILYIVTFLAFTYSTITFITRCFIKWQIFGPDDAAMGLAQVASLVQFSLLLGSLSVGLGKTFGLLSIDEYAQMALFQYGNQIALYISLGFSKIATILLTQRLFTRDMKRAWVACNLVTGAIIIWTVLSALLVSVGCSPSSLAPQTPSQTCPGIISRYQFIVATDAITDIILIIIPAYFCWQLQMSILIKLQVLAVFAFRLPLIGLSGLFLKAWIRSLSTPNPGVARTSAILVQQSELCFSLIAGTIPCLKSFLKSFDTNSGVLGYFGSSNGYSSNGRERSHNALNHTQSYKLSSLSHSKADTSHSRSRRRDEYGDVRVLPRSFASGRSSPTQVTRGDSTRGGYDRRQREQDRESQCSRTELVIRKDLVWEVSSDVRRDGDTPGMLRLPR